MVIALNMMDEMRANGNTVDVNGLEAELGVPVVPISAAKNEGIDELIEHALRAAEHKQRPRRQQKQVLQHLTLFGVQMLHLAAPQQ